MPNPKDSFSIEALAEHKGERLLNRPTEEGFWALAAMTNGNGQSVGEDEKDLETAAVNSMIERGNNLRTKEALHARLQWRNNTLSK